MAAFPDGFRAYSGRVEVMPALRYQDCMMFSVVTGGSYCLLYGGRRIILEDGMLLLLWAAIPHQDIQVNGQTRYDMVHVPLPWFMHCRLPPAFVARLLYGNPLLARSDDAANEVSAFVRWHADLHGAEPERHDICRGEIEMRLRRLALQQPAAADAQPDASTQRDTVVEMARYIAQNYRQPISQADIAAATGLTPIHAARRFRRIWRMSPAAFVNRYRIAEAQRLLATTDLKIIDVALQAGFGSLSQFYVEFQRAVGSSPRHCRQLLTHPLRQARN